MKEEAEAAVETAKSVLQDLVVVVSLVRTLTESFGSASDLYRKLKRKSKSKDGDGEEENKRERHRRPSRRRRDSSSDPDRERERYHHISWHLDSRRDDDSDSDEELIQKSSSVVRAEYDRGYRKLGEPFARGDLMTQTQLQAQIIELQRTLLSIHQDYMLSTYLSPSSSHSHLIRLIQTTRSARAASVQALNMQYRRMLPHFEPGVPDQYRNIPGAFPLPLPSKDMPLHDSSPRRRKSRTRSSSSDCSSDREKLRIQPFPNLPSKPHSPPQPHGNRLFCVYARDLQDHSRLPLTDNYNPSGDNMCPFCHSHIATRPGKAWEIIADGAGEHKRRTFLAKNRFAVKSHRENGGFACVLCTRFKESDTVCREIAALMEHLWKDHTGEELEQDDDIVEIEE